MMNRVWTIRNSFGKGYIPAARRRTRLYHQEPSGGGRCIAPTCVAPQRPNSRQKVMVVQSSVNCLSQCGLVSFHVCSEK